MSRFFRCLNLAWALSIAATASAMEKEPGIDSPVPAVVETTLPTQEGRIRQFAFDGDESTYFASAKNVGKSDHFTLVFARPIAVKTIKVITGTPKDGDLLDSAVLETSTDGKKFEGIAKFTKGIARADPEGQKIRAIRIQAIEDRKYPLTIREIAIESTPGAAIFRYPVEFSLNVADAPEMLEWAEKTARICEREYAMINEELKSESYRPPQRITMSLKTDYNGVAATSGDQITGSVKYFKAHPDDVGAMIHETTHVVQRYRTRNNPGWLVEGIADYVRFFKYEPGKIGPINAQRAHYNDSYRVSAAFLDYLTNRYDPEIVRKLNRIMREGEYKDAVFKTLTKKSLPELDEEWRSLLKEQQKPPR